MADISAQNYLQNSAVITVDWVGFIVLFGSSIVLVFKLMTFKGPNSQPESYFFGYNTIQASAFLKSQLLTHTLFSNPKKGIENQR